MLTAPRNLISIGRAARQCGTDVDRFAEAADKLGVKAAETIDDVPLVTREDRDRVKEHLDRERQGGNR